MRTPLVLDVSGLPTTAFGARTPLWWAVWGLVVIESTMFAILVASYVYLWLDAESWPPTGTPLPGLTAATVNVGMLVLSLAPMVWVHRAAHRHARLPVLAGLSASVVLGLGVIALRVLEFRALGCRWDSHAYGSIVWTIVGMHTFHVATSAVETAVLTVYLFRRPLDEKHRLDLNVNALYWYFVTVWWLPAYALVYFGPSLL